MFKSQSALPKIVLATVCDESYVTQALAMIFSVEETTSWNIEWHILALTNEAQRLLRKNSRANFKTYQIEDLDVDFQTLRYSRPWREYCWTSASVFLDFVCRDARCDYIGYLEADCFFLNDISDYAIELKDASILIFPHDFSKDREFRRYQSGDYNVGLILGKPDKNFKLCISDWRRQVMRECILDPLNGKCGDQTYLNEWPEKYSFVRVLDRKGSALGPWNINNYEFIDKESWKIDNMRIHFYHFHGLLICKMLKRVYLYLPAPGYKHKVRHRRFLYSFYMKSLIRTASKSDTMIRVKGLRDFFAICLKLKTLPRLIMER